MNEITIKQKKPVTEERFTVNNVLRERYIEHTEVLDEVKPLFLIPYIECMTTMQLANYYEVSEADIRSCYENWKSEFTSDGARKYTFAEAIQAIESQDNTSSLVKRCTGRAEVRLANDKFAYIGTRGVYLFPKRAILRMGMLLTNLTENDIAKKVRTQLVNIAIPVANNDTSIDTDVNVYVNNDVAVENNLTDTENFVDCIVENSQIHKVQAENVNNTKCICIHGVNITPKMYNGQRVVTFKDIDMIHQRADGTARKRFNDNKTHFIEGEDYFVRNSDEATRYGIIAPNGLKLITESGYLMLVKSFTDELSWQVQRELVKSYFKVQETTLTTGKDDFVKSVLTSPDFLLQLVTQFKESEDKRKQLETTVAIQSDQITKMKPKVNYYDMVLQSPDLIPISIIAKDYGKSAQWLNNYLWKHNIQYKLNGTWVLYASYADKGYTGTKTHSFEDSIGMSHSVINTYWTQSGRLFIYELLKKDNVLPLMECDEENTDIVIKS